MAKYITIDGGTTNTRLSLVIDNVITDTVKYNIGALVGGDDKCAFKNTLKEGIGKLLERNSVRAEEICRILASGMITSEAGICTLDHICTPCGIEEMSKNMYETVMPEISDIPFVFSRGVKTGSCELERLDVMRGEETELLGLSEKVEKNCLYVLPGSHSKLIYTDDSGRIADISTALTGELISAVSRNTILKNSVSLNFASLNEEYLKFGYAYAKKNGITGAFFKVRVLDKFLHRSGDETYSFFIGSALQSEIDNMIGSEAEKIIVGGKSELRRPISILLSEYSDKEITEVEDDITGHAATYGIIRLFEFKK